MKRIKTICVVGKSGSGKSTFVDIATEMLDANYVRSYTTRKERELDPNDKNTHTFVDEEYYEKHKLTSLTTYTSPEGYHSWVDIHCFDKDKVNIFAIDPNGLKLFKKYHELFNILTFYIDIDEKIRKERLESRGQEYRLEDFLDKKELVAIKEFYLDINNNGSIEDFKREINDNINIYKELN